MHPTDARKQGIAQVRVCDITLRKELQKKYNYIAFINKNLLQEYIYVRNS
jgi:hypothetical protein